MPLKTRLNTHNPINDHASTCSGLTDAAPAAVLAHHPASDAVAEEAVRPSNDPTQITAMNDIAPKAALSDRAEAAGFARDRHFDERGEEGEGKAPGSWEIDAFLEELRHGLPRSYGIDTEDAVILDAEGYRVCGLMRVISFPRRPDGSGCAIEVEFPARDGRLHRATVSQSEVTRGTFLTDLVDHGLARYMPLCRWRAI